LAAHLLHVPLFESYRLVIVPSLEGLDRESRDILLELAASLPESVFLIVCTELSPREFARRGPTILGKLRKVMTLVDFSPPREGELRGRVQEISRNLGYRIEDEALKRLLATTGGDAGAVRREMEKLALFVPEGGTVGVAEVETVVSRGGEVDVWTLADAIGRKDARNAQAILSGLLRSGERPVQIVGALWYTLVRIAWCRELIEEGVDETEIGKRLRLQPWRVRGFLSKAARFSRQDCHRNLDILFELDVALRSGGRAIHPVLSRGIVEMISGTA
jgi:DNA polymerase-3 subunit delta